MEIKISAIKTDLVGERYRRVTSPRMNGRATTWRCYSTLSRRMLRREVEAVTAAMLRNSDFLPNSSAEFCLG